MKYTALLVLILLCSITFSQSQYGGFTSIGKQDGMFHTNTNTIYEDSKGFMWFATTDGLIRFDGVQFNNFRKKRGNAPGLSTNSITSIIEDKNAYVFWLGNRLGGIDRFDIEKNTYEHYYIPLDTANEKAVMSVTAMYQIDESLFLVGTENQGLYYFYPDTKQFKSIRDRIFTAYNLPDNIYRFILGSDCLWVPSSAGILKFNLKGDLLNILALHQNALTHKSVSEPVPIYDLCECDSTSFIFTANNCVYRYNHETQETDKILNISNDIAEIRNVVKDDHRGIWIGSNNNGIYYYSRDSNSLKHYYTVGSNRNEIPNNEITTMVYSHHQNILWIGTRRGVSKYDYNDIKFKPIVFHNMVDDLVNNAYFLAKDSEDGYWFSSGYHLYYKKSQEKKFEKFQHDSMQIYYGFIEDTLGNAWLATKYGLYRYNLKTEKGKRFLLRHKSHIDNEINSLSYFLKANNSSVWVLSHKGLVLFDLYSHSYQLFPFNNEVIRSYSRFSSMDYSPDKKSIWISMRNGILMKFDLGKQDYTVYHLNEKAPYSQHNIILLDIEFVDNNTIWLATYGEGLLSYHIQQNKISNELAEGMLENYAYGMVRDDNNNIWVSSNMGIVCININSHKQIIYDSSDGVLCDEFNDNSYFKTQNGEFLFGGINGFIEFDPSNIYHNTYKAPIQVNSVEITVEGEFQKEILYSGNHYLSIEKIPKEIKINVSVLDYRHTERCKYKWRLKGYDNQWREAQISEPIVLSNLPGKTYRLELIGINNDGYEIQSNSVFTLKVKEAFVDSIFFKMLVLFIIVFLVYLFIRLRLRWYLKQEYILTEKVNHKTKELKDAYADLESSREKVYSQKAELEIHRNYLEDLVLERTKDLETAKLKAEESDRLKTSFLANLSHEIRTPMNAIIGFSTLLLTDEFDDKQRKEFVNVVHQSSESLLVLINDIIDISRIETGNIRLIKQDFAIRDVVKETLDELVFEEKSEDVRFRQYLEIDSEDEIIYNDKHRLKQIISNLLRNAFKFTQEGYVHLTIRSVSTEAILEKNFEIKPSDDSNRCFLIEVSDSGIGMNEEQMKIIFEPFRKVRTELKFYKGMGLGLSIVKSLLHFMGGDIMVQSEIGKGTTFTLYMAVDK